MLIYLSWECSLETTRKHGVGTYFHLELKKKKATKQYFEVIYCIIVAYEGASNRAVANSLHLSCLATGFILNSLFFLFLALALPFWY